MVAILAPGEIVTANPPPNNNVIVALIPDADTP